MKMDMNIQRKPFRVPSILWRRIHKWVGLVLGLQFVLWTFSGAVMALLDMEKVGGHSAPSAASAPQSWPSDIRLPALPGPVDALTLWQLVDRPVFEIRNAEGRHLLDARTGEPVSIDRALAEKIARKAFHHEAPVRSITFLDGPNLEAREHPGPMWRVDFSDDENSSAYISAENGVAHVNRGDTWRTWDFVWMLHNMDYVNRTSFNHPLIIFVAFGALWLSFTGFYLLFKSFRRRDFRWVIGRGKA